MSLKGGKRAHRCRLGKDLSPNAEYASPPEAAVRACKNWRRVREAGLVLAQPRDGVFVVSDILGSAGVMSAEFSAINLIE
jgi:hypothetical protein